MNKNQKNGALGFVFTLFMSFSFAQEQPANEIHNLLRERTVLSEKKQDYSAQERQLVALGHTPAALVTKTESEGKVKFEFISYKNIRPDREEAIAARIRSSVPGIHALEVANQHVAVIFDVSATETNIADFFKLSGYAGYEIKN